MQPSRGVGTCLVWTVVAPYLKTRLGLPSPLMEQHPPRHGARASLRFGNRHPSIDGLPIHTQNPRGL